MLICTAFEINILDSSIRKGATYESITETLTVLSDFGILRSGAGLGVARNSEDDMIDGVEVSRHGDVDS